MSLTRADLPWLGGAILAGGAAVSLMMLGEASGWLLWTAALLMGGGIWLHLSESHGHFHQHDPPAIASIEILPIQVNGAPLLCSLYTMALL